MNVVFVNRSPDGPASVPVFFTSNLSQSTESSRTVTPLINFANARLESLESSQVTRITPPSAGLGLKKCVINCPPASSNNVACGVNNVNLTPKGQFGVAGSQGAQT